MSLLDRLIGNEEPKIPLHLFRFALQEFLDGRVTGAQGKAILKLDTAEANTLTTAIGIVQTANDPHELLSKLFVYLGGSELQNQGRFTVQEAGTDYTNGSLIVAFLNAEIAGGI